MLERIKLATHLLRGRSVVYRVRINHGQELPVVILRGPGKAMLEPLHGKLELRRCVIHGGGVLGFP